MHTLPEIQALFMRAIAGGEHVSAARLRIVRAEHAERRLAIHAHNASQNFIQALRATFPAILRLVGEDYFARAALDYRREAPSRSGDLQYAGEGFAAYLRKLHSSDAYRYLGDVAQLEWLYQECSIAADHAALDVTRLASVAPAAYDALRFLLHPSVRLMCSEFPVLEIWRANLAPGEPPEIDLRAGAETLLLSRTADVSAERLARCEFELTNSIRLGRPFAAAIEAAIEADPHFDATCALRKLITRGVIVDFSAR